MDYTEVTLRVLQKYAESYAEQLSIETAEASAIFEDTIDTQYDGNAEACIDDLDNGVILTPLGKARVGIYLDALSESIEADIAYY